MEARGWLVHCVADEFPDDAKKIPDEDWIEHGLVVHGGTLFHLDNQQLPIAAMVERFVVNLPHIERAAGLGGPAIYAVSAGSIRKTWP